MIPFNQTKNYQKSNGVKKIGFVLHGTLGAYSGAVEWLLNSDRPNPTSAHYVIGREEGQVVQLVRNEDIAWHAGIISNPAKRFTDIMPKNANGTFKSPNHYFIGIEFVWGYDMDRDGTIEAVEKVLTPWQYKCALDIMQSSGIADPILVSHHEIASYKADNMLFAIPAFEAILHKPAVQTPTTPVKNQEELKEQMRDLADKFVSDVHNLIDKLS